MLTHNWWEQARSRFELCTSEVVVDEAAACDPELAALRLQYLAGISLLEMNDAAKALAKRIIDANVLPPNATRDAFHIAIGTAHEVDFLLTWNCRHIANAVIIKRLQKISDSHGFALPLLCTPEELMGE